MELLATNVAHGLVALIWLLALRGLAGPLPPTAWERLLELGVILPLFATLLHGFDAASPPAWLTVLRTLRWHDAIAASGGSLLMAPLLLCGGTALLFVAQELAPRLLELRAARATGDDGSPRLQASLDRVKAAFAAQGKQLGRRRQARLARARVRRTDSARRQALLTGVSTPTVSVSRGLDEALDDEALDAVIAHELSHLFVGGRSRLLVLWLLRLPQAASPATLLLFRSLIEARESACDTLAARVTGKPLALAAALLEAHRLVSTPGANESAWKRAQRRVLRRAEVASVRARVARLRGDAAEAPAEPISLLTYAWAALLLGGLLWLVG